MSRMPWTSLASEEKNGVNTPPELLGNPSTSITISSPKQLWKPGINSSTCKSLAYNTDCALMHCEQSWINTSTYKRLAYDALMCCRRARCLGPHNLIPSCFSVRKGGEVSIVLLCYLWEGEPGKMYTKKTATKEVEWRLETRIQSEICSCTSSTCTSSCNVIRREGLFLINICTYVTQHHICHKTASLIGIFIELP